MGFLHITETIKLINPVVQILHLPNGFGNRLHNFCCAGLWPRSVVSKKFTKPIFMEVLHMVSDLKPVKEGRLQKALQIDLFKATILAACKLVAM